MPIKKLNIHNIRNITKANLDFHPKLNVFNGRNGSGKTSLLESLYLLGVGKSFRANKWDNIISKDNNFCLISADMVSCSDKEFFLGLEKNINGDLNFKKSGKVVNSRAEIIKEIPMLLIYLQGYQLFSALPAYRRKLLDWAMFHVEHCFAEQWNRYSKVIKYRNNLLKEKKVSTIKSWDEQLSEIAENIKIKREVVFNKIRDIFLDLCHKFTDSRVDIKLYHGWSNNKSLIEVIRESLTRDLILGYTQFGLHRADIRLKIDDQDARYYLSIGQQKLISLLLNIAHAKIVCDHSNKTLIYLVDDLFGEISSENYGQIISLLTSLNIQLFITCLNKEESKLISSIDKCKMFHVEHGKFKEME